MVQLLGLGAAAKRLGLSREATAAAALRENLRPGTHAMLEQAFAKIDRGEAAPADGEGEKS
jgi:hypothetical protein